MADLNFRQFQSAARIVLICPDCGHQNSEFADVLRGTRFYACRGDDCYYSFDLTHWRRDFGKSLAAACKTFYAAFDTVRGQAFGLKSLRRLSGRFGDRLADRLGDRFNERDRVGESGDAEGVQLLNRLVSAHAAGRGVAGGKPDE
jgi:hypothetical protein